MGHLEEQYSSLERRYGSLWQRLDSIMDFTVYATSLRQQVQDVQECQEETSDLVSNLVNQLELHTGSVQENLESLQEARKLTDDRVQSLRAKMETTEKNMHGCQEQFHQAECKANERKEEAAQARLDGLVKRVDTAEASICSANWALKDYEQAASASVSFTNAEIGVLADRIRTAEEHLEKMRVSHEKVGFVESRV